MVAIAAVWRQFFEPFHVIFVQAGFVIVDEYTRSDMHGIYQAQAFLYAAFVNGLLNIMRDVNELVPFFGIEP